MKRHAVLRLAGCICLVLFTGLHPAAAQKDITRLILVPGQQKTIDAPDMNRIAVGNPAIADVKALEGSRQVLVTAVGEGQTDIIIWDNDDHQRSIKVKVVMNDPRKVAGEIRMLLDGVEGIEVKALDSRVIIDGKALRKEDLHKINQIAKIYPQVTNLATLSPAVVDTIVKYLNIEFKDVGLTRVAAERLGNQIIVQGEVPNEDAKDKIELIASAFEVNVKNFVKVGVTLEKMIVVHVDFIEIDKDAMTEAGIDWGQAINVTSEALGSGTFGLGADSQGFNGAYKIEAAYGAAIKLLKNNKNAHILARPKLLCRSGEKAEFLAGGEIPIRIATAFAYTVEYKEFGIILNIEPVADNNGNIATSITVENSSVTDFVDGQPTFQSSRVKTSINVKSGQIIVLSGLVNREHTKAVDKVPVLGSIPILGELFKSRAFKSNKSELVIFVTPEVLSPETLDTSKVAQERRERVNHMKEEFKFKLLD
jgi:pilus assembly protein CpaC